MGTRLANAKTYLRRADARVKIARIRHQRNEAIGRPGVTVVTANWNSARYALTLIKAVKRFSPEVAEIIVVDNGSTDGSVELLHGVESVRVVSLRRNMGHGAALDIGLLEAETETVVVLDVDAFPIASDWLETVVGPLSTGAVVSGAYFRRGFVHPCFLALRRSQFLEHKLSFMPIGQYSPEGRYHRWRPCMDVGELLSHEVGLVHGTAAVHRIPATAFDPESGAPIVFGDVVFHSFDTTHGTIEKRSAAGERWQDAVRRYLGSDFLELL